MKDLMAESAGLQVVNQYNCIVISHAKQVMNKDYYTGRIRRREDMPLIYRTPLTKNGQEQAFFLYNTVNFARYNQQIL